MDEDVMVTVRADTAPFMSALAELDGLADAFGSQLTGALKSAVIGGKELDDILRRVALNLAGMALNQGMAPLGSLFGSFFSRILGAIVPFAAGGVPGRVTPFASGGVVAAPTYFGMPGGLGLMGETGAEAILPLQRGPDGRLGVASGGRGAGPTIVFNVTTPDAASFRKSEAQVAGMLARVASRGSRTM